MPSMRRALPTPVSLFGDRELHRDIVAINLTRLTWLIAIFLIVHAAHIAAFWPYTPGASDVVDLWHNQVMLVHTVLILFLVLILPAVLLAHRSRRVQEALRFLPELTGMIYLLAGATLAIIDQRVNPTITPLLAASMGCALAIISRPATVLLAYPLTLWYFIVGVAWVQPDPNLLLTVRVNGITAVGLGLGLALLQWRNQMISLQQQRRIAEQQAELEAKNRELTRLATTDGLTGLLNRTAFNSAVSREIDRLRENGLPAALIMLDLDNFKLLNDTYGHPVGDRVLVEMAEILTRTLPDTAILARMGGEEFAVLLPGHTVDEGMQAAERVQASLRERHFSDGEEMICVTASFGVAPVDPALADALEQGYRAADEALYMAKHAGRNCILSAR